MRMGRLTCVLALTANLFAMRIAAALPQSPERIPHGSVFGCETCHPGNKLQELNEIGRLLQGIRHAYVSPNDWWVIMYNVDSDGDGLTNGEELGDPCGEWRVGSQLPTVSVVSNPGDSASRIESSFKAACPPIAVAGDAPNANAIGSAGAGAEAVTEPAPPTPYFRQQGCAFRLSTGSSDIVQGVGLLVFSVLRRGRRRR